MIAAVLDTNVLASGFVGLQVLASPPGQIIRAWLAGQFNLVTSEHIQTEIHRTFARPYFRARLSIETIADAEDLLRRRATTTSITVEAQGVATHPEDDAILATAVSGQVQYLVTGDTKLQRLGSYQGVTIVSPRQFVEVITDDPE